MAVQAQGFMKLQIETGTTPAYVDVPGVTNVAGGGLPGAKIDTTNFDTPAGEKESIPGPRDNSPYTFDLQYKPEDATQELLFAAEASNAPAKFRIKMGTKGITFSAVPTLTLAAPVAGLVTYSGSVEPMAKAARATITP